VNESRVITIGVLLGAAIGASASYLFFTESGKQFRDRMEPAVDDLRREFARFQRVVEKLGEMANDGLRAVDEFTASRQQSTFSTSRTSH
jgi:gas vesicle protein